MVAQLCEHTDTRWVGRCKWGDSAVRHHISTPRGEHPSSQFTESQTEGSARRCLPPKSQHTVGSRAEETLPEFNLALSLQRPSLDAFSSCRLGAERLPAAAQGLVQVPVSGAAV